MLPDTTASFHSSSYHRAYTCLAIGWVQWINPRITYTRFQHCGIITERHLGNQGKRWAFLLVLTSIFKAPLNSTEWKLLPLYSQESRRINSLNSSGLNNYPNRVPSILCFNIHRQKKRKGMLLKNWWCSVKIKAILIIQFVLAPRGGRRQAWQCPKGFFS